MNRHDRPALWRLFLILAALALVAAACGDDDDDDTGSDDTEESADTTAGDEATDDTATDDTEAAEDAADGEPFRIAAVMPSAANDLAFSQSLVDAISALQEENPAIEFDYSENLFVVEDAATALRDYAEDGYDLVIAHGSQYGGNLQEIAPDFPEVAFAWGPAADTFGLDNVSSYNSAPDQGGYAMGILAADLSESGTVGVIGPVEAGEPVDFITGFMNGVEAGGASATSNYIGSFSDVALATEAANSFISNGADVLTGTSQAMVGAVGAAQEAGALWFATQSNQAELAPDTVVASQVYHWEGILGEIIDGIAGGTLGGQTLEINLENEGIVMEFNDDVAIDDVEAAKALLDETVAGIVSGEIDTGAG